MSKQSKQGGFWSLAIIMVVVLGVVLFWRTRVFVTEPSIEQPAGEKQIDTAETTQKDKVQRRSMAEIIADARGWGPEERLALWFGEKATDFTLNDITGKTHTLSDYRGKNVMVVLWATWCGPCLMEIPHLKELRESVSEEELAILAISNESQRLVKNFAAKKKLNYTVFAANVLAMPKPFSRVNSIPSSFFIDKQGKIKLITSGLISLRDIRAILQTEW